jgi:uncharacterized protein
MIETSHTNFLTAQAKELELRNMMRGFGRVLVAYSGGVDSSYLAAIATSELDDNALCVTGLSPSVSEFQREKTFEIALQFGFRHQTVDTQEMLDAEYVANGSDRCFHCKDELYSVLKGVSEGFGSSAIIDGTNADDLSDHRPGRKAAEQHMVFSPLAELGFSKNEIRELSRHLGLPTWEMPSSPCLSSRIAPGVPVTIERLGKVDRAEAFLRGLGFNEFRVRIHDDLARIEIAKAEMAKMAEAATIDAVTEKFEQIGFRFITLDLKGFRSGSMNLRKTMKPGIITQ